MSFEKFDLLVLAVLLFCTIRGAMKGVVWQLASIGALVACFMFSEQLSAKIAPHIAVKEPLNRWIAMFALYMAFSLVSFAIARALHDWIEKAKFKEYDRHLGAIFGLTKGIVFSLVLTFFIVTLSDSARGQILNSRSGNAAAIIMDRLHAVMPHELHAVLEPYIHRLDKDGLDLKAHGDGHDHKSEHSNDETKPPTVPRDPFDILDPFSSRTDVPQSPGTDGIRTTALAPKPIASIAERDRLMLKVSQVYFDSPNAQQSLVEEFQEMLQGIPLQVQVAVLADLETDLTDPNSDSTPETTYRTGFGERIRWHWKPAVTRRQD